MGFQDTRTLNRLAPRSRPPSATATLFLLLRPHMVVAGEAQPPRKNKDLDSHRGCRPGGYPDCGRAVLSFRVTRQCSNNPSCEQQPRVRRRKGSPSLRALAGPVFRGNSVEYISRPAWVSVTSTCRKARTRSWKISGISPPGHRGLNFESSDATCLQSPSPILAE